MIFCETKYPGGNDGSAAGGGKSDPSEWQRSARHKPALTGEVTAGYRNRCDARPYDLTDKPEFEEHKNSRQSDLPGEFLWSFSYYSWGPAATRALPSSLPVYLVKFLMKRADRSLALVSHSSAFA